MSEPDRKPFISEPEPSLEPPSCELGLPGWDKMKENRYPFSQFIGVDVSKAKLDFAFADEQKTVAIKNTGYCSKLCFVRG